MTLYEQAIKDAYVPMRTGILSGYDAFDLGRRLLGGLTGNRRDPRRDLVGRFSFAIPNEDAIGHIRWLSPILEIGAGTGYWAHELRQRGADVIATDPSPIAPDADGEDGYGFRRSWGGVEKMTGWRSIRAHPDRTLMMVWPCYDRPWPWRCLAAYQGERFIYVGEGKGGCTGDDRFHDLLDARFEEERVIEIPQWLGIHDDARIYRRRETK